MSNHPTGRCGCGAVRFEVTAPLGAAFYCHCTRCQRRTGTGAAPSVRVQPGSVRILEGGDRLDAWAPPQGMQKLFCRECGSAVFASRPGLDVAAVRMSAFDEDPGVRPQWRQFVAYAAPWEPLPDDGLPRYDERAP